MITVKYRGQTGNQLFQYAYARLLARITGRELNVMPVDHFEELEQPHWPQSSNGVIHLIQNSSHGKVLSFETVGKMIDGFDVELECYFENSELFRMWRGEIRSWFTPAREDVDSAGIHVRGKDAKHLSPPLSYYLEAIGGIGLKQGIEIYTDNPEDDVVKSLSAQLLAPVHSGNVREDFEAMRRHTTLIIGNSTFAWWAAFTSDPSHTIIQPEPTSGFRSRHVPNSCLLLPYWEQIKYEP